MFSVTLAPKLPYTGAVLTLSLDTSSRGGSVAVLRDLAVLGVVSTWGDEAYSSRIFRQLEFLLSELGLKLDQFELFAVAAGPGSFTGLRVGLASAKAWSEAYGKPVAGVSALEAVAAQCAYPATWLVPVVDARRGQFYGASYRREADGELRLEGDECVVGGDELLKLVRERSSDGEVAVVATEPELVTRLVEPAGTKVFRASNVLAPWIGQLAVVRAKQGKLSDALTLDANYVRRSDAELDAKGR
jgi:tRNA threonylcarbamoyladenosine biosynthesis protein TsaB